MSSTYDVPLTVSPRQRLVESWERTLQSLTELSVRYHSTPPPARSPEMASQLAGLRRRLTLLESKLRRLDAARPSGPR
jgi:hypothetical protein